jgi:hypothetical protein
MLDIDVNAVVDKLGDQIKQMSKSIAVKDAYIESLKRQLAEMKKED